MVPHVFLISSASLAQAFTRSFPSCFPIMAPKRCRILLAPPRKLPVPRARKERTLQAPDSNARTPSPQPRKKRTRTLEKPEIMRRRVGTSARNPARATLSLVAETDFEYSSNNQSSDGTTSCKPGIRLPEKRLKERLLQAKSTRRTSLAAAATQQPTLGQLTLLERVTVKSQTEKSYEQAMNLFVAFCDVDNRRLVEDAEVDAELVRFFNERFAAGQPAHQGEVCMAALMHFQPQFSRVGDAKLPRAWKALKGWRRRAPCRSRLAYPFQVWAAMCWVLARNGHWGMAAYVLWMVVTYNRPSEPLTVQRRDLSRPMIGVSPQWTVLLWPAERDGRSKVLGSDDSLTLDTKIVPWFPQLVEVLSEGPQAENIFNFTYAEFNKEFTRARRKLRIKRLVPYQARHSGASIDLCLLYRSIPEVKGRGRWASEKSMLRYNRAAKLAQSMKQFDQRQQDFFVAAERQLEELFFGKVAPEALRLP